MPIFSRTFSITEITLAGYDQIMFQVGTSNWVMIKSCFKLVFPPKKRQEKKKKQRPKLHVEQAKAIHIENDKCVIHTLR